MLDITNLSVRYGQHPALKDASIHVGRGEIVVILGANGAGKSSLLKAISGISEGKVTGSVQMQGNELVDQSPDKIVEAGIALVPEGRGVFPDLTVQDNLKLGSHSHRARDDMESNLNRILSLFPKLRERSKQIVRTMSGGEQQMVAIGRAMMSNPAILTLDEPSLGLSPLLCKDLFQSLKAVRDAGIGILLVEQNAKQSLAIADRGYLIENGSIVHEAPAQALMNDPAVQAAYLGGATAGGHTAATKSKATKPAISTQPTTTAQIPMPTRPSTQNPSDIAAAALQKFARPAATPSQPPAAQPITAPKPAVPTPPPPAAPKPAQPVKTQPRDGPAGIDINNLVARARDTSAAQVSQRSNGHARPQSYPSAQTMNGVGHQPTPARSEVKMPDLTDTQDRLKSALAEIEEAAARARAYRPNRSK